MNTSSLEEALRRLHVNIPYFVTDAIDSEHIINRDKYPFVVIQNTDTGRGKHWIAWYVQNETDGEYFDSYANPVTKYVNVKPPIVNIVKENCKPVQRPSTFNCGEFCIYWIYHRCRGITFENIMHKFKRILGYNDALVVNFVKNIPGYHRHSLYDCKHVVQSNINRLSQPNCY